MTIIPVDDRVPACLGIMCELHHRCARYAAVEDGIEGKRIGTCEDEGARPLFVPVRVAGAMLGSRQNEPATGTAHRYLTAPGTGVPVPRR